MLLNVQLLRAVAAYLVVTVHLGTLLFAAGVSQEPTVFGNCGVDLFFVISGYLMVLTTSEKPTSAKRFILSRIIRVVPMYWICTLLVFSLAMFTPDVLRSTSASTIDLVKSLIFIPFDKGQGRIQPVLFLGWTLNYEMFFYFVFALSLLLPRRRSAVAALLVIWAMPLFGWLFPSVSIVVRFYGDLIVLEFAIGMALALAMRRWGSLSPMAAWLAILAGAAVLLGRYLVVPLGERALWSGVPATAILCGAISLETHGYACRSRFVQLLGVASYTLYLVHPFVIQAFVKAVPIAEVAGSPVLLTGTILLVLGLVGAVAVTLHWTVERPLTRLLRALVGQGASTVEREETQLTTRGIDLS